MTWTNKGKCSDLSGDNQADGNFRLLSNHHHLELTYSLVSDSNMDLPPMVTPTKSGTLDTLSTICPRSLRMASTAPTTAVLKCQAVWIKYELAPFATRRTCHLQLYNQHSMSGHHVSFNPHPQFTLVCWHYDALTLSTILYLV
jgi:hypothetical protein